MGVAASALAAAAADAARSEPPLADGKVQALLESYPRSMVGTDANFKLLWLLARAGSTDALDLAVRLARYESGKAARRAARPARRLCYPIKVLTALRVVCRCASLARPLGSAARFSAFVMPRVTSDTRPLEARCSSYTRAQGRRGRRRRVWPPAPAPQQANGCFWAGHFERQHRRAAADVPPAAPAAPWRAAPRQQARRGPVRAPQGAIARSGRRRVRFTRLVDCEDASLVLSSGVGGVWWGGGDCGWGALRFRTCWTSPSRMRPNGSRGDDVAYAGLHRGSRLHVAPPPPPFGDVLYTAARLRTQCHCANQRNQHKCKPVTAALAGAGTLTRSSGWWSRAHTRRTQTP